MNYLLIDYLGGKHEKICTHDFEWFMCHACLLSARFGDHLMRCTNDHKKFIEIFIGDDAITSSGSQRQKMRKQGMVGMLWDVDFYNSNKKSLSRKIVWAKPKKLSDKSYRMNFPGYKSFVFTYLFFEVDKPDVKIEEEGGRILECYVDLEMLNKGI